ncbi:MAG: VOC family protein [Cyclobacteriaceae bacterium]|nr:VOC family protein [Cyclobacteriaceae bacterium]
MAPSFISGIQQVGIGVADAEQAFAWYRRAFGMDICVFKDKAEASLMTRYTGGTRQSRYAILAMNLQGGGGFEIWQYTSRLPAPLARPVSFDQHGILAIKLKTRDIVAALPALHACGPQALSPIVRSPEGKRHLYLCDPFGHWFEVVEETDFFSSTDSAVGGVCGAVIGVSQLDRALRYFQTFGFDRVLVDRERLFEDWDVVPGTRQVFRRVLLGQSRPMQGSFGGLLGPVTLELIEARERQAGHVFAGRQWGDCGFIHLCFDVHNLPRLAQTLANTWAPCTVDSSSSFDMGNASGHFCYHEDPDGTLIELVETHRLPLIPAWGWSLNLKARSSQKPLPRWLLGLMRFSRVR